MKYEASLTHGQTEQGTIITKDARILGFKGENYSAFKVKRKDQDHCSQQKTGSSEAANRLCEMTQHLYTHYDNITQYKIARQEVFDAIKNNRQ